MRDQPVPDLATRLATGLGTLFGRLPDLPGLAERVAAFVACIEVTPGRAGFKYIAPEAQAVHAGILREAGEQGARIFLLACLLSAVRSTLRSGRADLLPARVRAHQFRQFERIAAHDDSVLQYCRLEADVFLKELGLATLRLYAGASSVIDPHSGVGRSLLWKAGLRKLPGRLLFFVRAGGFRPYFEVHVHKLYLDEFNEAGRNECYRCCADLYSLYPDVLGMIGGSWFYDPAVEAISPHLAYLRKVPESGGARVLYVSHDTQAVGNATATSEKRRALHAAGRYRPASWTLVWIRRDQIAWSHRSDVLDRN
ncbi:hypothetical protein ACHAC9_11955 [Massilia sp. CMS3.1]|uniref:hypothetical protein n=1 Tax=Massilia sp. CMS3.1 TaxID=3373083 RepID=UPI003EE6A663